MDKLRDEILQAELARTDLFKWKLGLIGAIGGVGLGLAGSKTAHSADLVLGVLPLVCLYVDLACWHLALRILVIGSYIRKSSNPDSQSPSMARYEQYACCHRIAFDLENFVLHYSTILISLALAIYGVGIAIHGGGIAFDKPTVSALVFIPSGVIGVAGACWGYCQYWQRWNQLEPRRGKTLCRRNTSCDDS